MKCYICSKEATEFTPRYVERVCMECDAMFVEHDRKAEIQRKEYDKNHALCPNCGYDHYTTTLAGFTRDVDHPELYKDLNDCVCGRCGDKHVRHDRTPKQN